VYDFLPYGGENTFHRTSFTEYENMYFGLGQKVIVELCKSIPSKPLSVVCFDNWFTSLELVTYLRKSFGILSLGTIQQNRLRGCNIIADKPLLKKGRGSYETKSDNKNKISVVKWADNKCVTIVNSYISTSAPSETVSRYDKNKKERVNVKCTKVIKEYNSHMGGVDLADMFVSLYRTGIKSHRWYLAIFSQLLDIGVNNAWLLYRRHYSQLNNNQQETLQLKHFRYEIAKSLLAQSSIGRPSTNLILSKRKRKAMPIEAPPKESRLDNIDHFPIYNTKGRCTYCTKGQTVFSCSKCSLRLCLTKERNCFYSFHKAE